MRLHPWQEGSQVLRVTVELVPSSSDKPRKQLGVVDITNEEHLKGDLNRYLARTVCSSGWQLEERAVVDHVYGDGWAKLVVAALSKLTRNDDR